MLNTRINHLFFLIGLYICLAFFLHYASGKLYQSKPKLATIEELEKEFLILILC